MYFKSRTQYLSVTELFEYIQDAKEFISPAELPYTGEPFYMLHPCNTQNILPDSSLSA